MEWNGNFVELVGYSENIDDVIIVIKLVIDDIMVMFVDLRFVFLYFEIIVRFLFVYENFFKIERLYINENVRGMERNCSFGEWVG